MITFDETLDRLKRISVSRGEDYSYGKDPKAFEAVHAQYPNADPFIDGDGDEYVTNCYYKFVDGTPGCIAGVFMSEVAPDFELEEHVNIFANVSRGRDVGANVPEFDDVALYLLREAQRQQDIGKKWPEAVEIAETTVRTDFDLD